MQECPHFKECPETRGQHQGPILVTILTVQKDKKVITVNQLTAPFCPATRTSSKDPLFHGPS